MNFRNEKRCLVPPVKPVLNGPQVRSVCADQWGVKKEMMISAEVPNAYHFEFPTEDGYRNIYQNNFETIDALTKLGPAIFAKALAQADLCQVVIEELKKMEVIK